MKFLFRILRRLVGYLLGVLLVALIAAAATFGWQGYKLYQSAVQATPLETLYQNITARLTSSSGALSTAWSPMRYRSTKQV